MVLVTRRGQGWEQLALPSLEAVEEAFNLAVEDRHPHADPDRGDAGAFHGGIKLMMELYSVVGNEEPGQSTGFNRTSHQDRYGRSSWCHGINPQGQQPAGTAIENGVS